MKRFSLRPAHLVWIGGLAAAVVAASGEIGARPGPAAAVASAPGAALPADWGTSVQASPSQGAAGRSAAAGQAQPQGRGNESSNRQGPANRTPWWQHEATQKAIGLRPDQIKRLDDIFAQRARDIEPLVRELEKQRAELDRLMNDRVTEMRTAIRAIELQSALVEVPRAKINESWSVMMFRQSRVLDNEQHRKYLELSSRRGRGGGPRP